MKLLKFKSVMAVAWTVAIIFFIFILYIITMSVSDFKPVERIPLETQCDRASIPPEKTGFSISTWNIGYFGLGEEMDFFYEGGTRVRPTKTEYERYSSGALDYFAGLDAVDFILLQEMDRNSKRSYRNDQFQQVAGVLLHHCPVFAVNYDVGFVPLPMFSPMGKVKSGIAVFSKYMPVECYRGALLGKYQWPKQLFMLDRCFIFCRFRLEQGKDLVIINTHNEAFDAGDMRDLQMKHLRGIMEEEYEMGNFVVAGGDWNMNPAWYREGPFTTGDIARTVPPEFDDDFFPPGWHWVFDPNIPTNRNVDQGYLRGKTPSTIIDYFIVSPNVDVVEVLTQDLMFKWSDHHPVTMKFRCMR
jgi:endonuclease/exonuclease/phosphatase family metal-dependent hydrolase